MKNPRWTLATVLILALWIANSPGNAAAQYTATNAADPNLVDAWGLAALANSPWLVALQNTGGAINTFAAPERSSLHSPSRGSLSLRSVASAEDDSGDAEAPRDILAKSSPPPALNVAGSWAGDIEDSVQGAGTISFGFTGTTTRTKGKVAGNWSISFPSTSPAGAYTDLGNQSGTVTATTMTVTAKPDPANKFPCTFVFRNMQASAEQLSGSYKLTGKCRGRSGTISLQPAAENPNPSVRVEDDFFAPSNLVISAGQTVTWTNLADDQHSVNNNPGSEDCKPSSTESFNSDPLDTSDTFQHTFNTPGSFPYHCQIHGCVMNGTITVN